MSSRISSPRRMSTPAPTPTPSADTERQEYTAPTVTDMGSIEDLTRGTGGFFGDNSQAQIDGGSAS